MQSVRVQKNDQVVSAELSFPGDKSLSHRAIMFGALSEGVSRFTNVLAGDDCLCTRRALEAMGIDVVSTDPTKIEVHGRGLRGLRAPQNTLYLGNSGTSMRVLSGILAGQPFTSVLTGDPSLSSRPMRRVTGYLQAMGARIDGRDHANFAPLTISGGKLRAIDVHLEVSSAQVKSAILLAGLYAEGTTRVTEPVKSRDHTERFLRYFGGHIEEQGLTVSVSGEQKLTARSFEIAGDISSAAFFMALAALLPHAEVVFRSVLWNPTRTGIVSVLERMGVLIQNRVVRSQGPELVADFKIVSSPLSAFEIRREELPALIDEIPILCVLATQARGTSVIHEADELRVKETDRIQSMVTNLSAMGANIRAEGNTLIIEGPTNLRGAVTESYEDHRTAMSMIVAGMIAQGDQIVRSTECINTSFPTFFESLNKISASYFIDTGK